MTDEYLPLIKEKCLVDSNIIYYAIQFEKDDISGLLAQVYGEVYIHKEVYNELNSAGQTIVKEKWKSKEWQKFDPDSLTAIESILYRTYTGTIQTELKKVDSQRGKHGQRGLGEIHSLAAALILNAQYICSNDFSIETVIENLDLMVYEGNDEEKIRLITQHKLLEFCKIVVENALSSRKIMKSFFQSTLIEIHHQDPVRYNHLKKLFESEIPPQS